VDAGQLLAVRAGVAVVSPRLAAASVSLSRIAGAPPFAPSLRAACPAAAGPSAVRAAQPLRSSFVKAYDSSNLAIHGGRKTLLKVGHKWGIGGARKKSLKSKQAEKNLLSCHSRPPRAKCAAPPSPFADLARGPSRRPQAAHYLCTTRLALVDALRARATQFRALLTAISARPGRVSLRLIERPPPDRPVIQPSSHD